MVNGALLACIFRAPCVRQDASIADGVVGENGGGEDIVVVFNWRAPMTIKASNAFDVEVVAGGWASKFYCAG